MQYFTHQENSNWWSVTFLIIWIATVKLLSPTMFLLILLTNQKLKLLISLKWVKDLKTKELLNYGVTYQKKIKYTVFYSPTISDEPDFTLSLQPVFNKNRIGCYQATILKPFGKSLFNYLLLQSFLVTIFSSIIWNGLTDSLAEGMKYIAVKNAAVYSKCSGWK